MVARLLDDHERECRRMDELRSSFEGAAYGDPWSRDTFVTRGREYVRSAREHAAWEEDVLLPLALNHLDPAMDAAMLRELIDVEAEHFGASTLGSRALAERVLGHAGPVTAMTPGPEGSADPAGVS